MEVQCPSCGTLNPIGSSILITCQKCGAKLILDDDEYGYEYSPVQDELSVYIKTFMCLQEIADMDDEDIVDELTGMLGDAVFMKGTERALFEIDKGELSEQGRKMAMGAYILYHGGQSGIKVD